MSRSHFEAQQPSSLISADSEPPPFHNNLHYQEVLATLRYGIITRKGLILLLGDAGTGKTTLLDQFVRELDSNVTCIFQSDPDVNFTDLLRLVLGSLEVTGDTRNGLSMMQRFKTILRSNLDQDQVVCLVIDNAQRLHDETLEYVLHNFFSTAPADHDENLLQIVLSGRPELRDKLAQPRLRSLKPRSDLLCQLRPLRDKDIAAYIANRLRAAQLPVDIFDSAAIDLIGAYTGGNPQLVNAISNRALQVSAGSPVTVEMVARAARSLDLSETRRPIKETVKQNLEIPNEPHEPFRLNDSDTTEVVGQTFLNYNFDDRRPAGRNRKTIRILLILVLLGAAAAWLQSEAGKAQLSNWIGEQNGTAESPQRPESNPDAPVMAKQNVPPAPAPSSENPTPRSSIDDSSSPSLPDKPLEPFPDKPLEPSYPPVTEKAVEKPTAIDPQPAPKKAPMSASKDRQTPVEENATARRKLLEAQIYRAIENRAIIGVTVSVIDDITYLEGRVATERQRNAAERAARSVAGVERVRNRIAVAVS